MEDSLEVKIKGWEWGSFGEDGVKMLWRYPTWGDKLIRDWNGGYMSEDACL